MAMIVPYREHFVKIYYVFKTEKKNRHQSRTALDFIFPKSENRYYQFYTKLQYIDYNKSA